MYFPVKWLPCVVRSVLQGARLCLLWRAGGDRNGSAVGQGPRRAFLRQHGPQQIPDGHRSFNLACPQPHLSSLTLTHLPVSLPVCLTDAQSEKNVSTSTRTYFHRFSCWAETTPTTTRGWYQKPGVARRNELAQTTQPSCWLGTTWHTSHIQQKMCTFFFFVCVFSENEQDSEFSRSTLLVLLRLWTQPPPSSTLTQPLPACGLLKLQQALYLSKANCVILNYWINISIFS